MPALSRGPHPAQSRPPVRPQQGISSEHRIVCHNPSTERPVNLPLYTLPLVSHATRTNSAYTLVLTMAACSSRSASSAEYSCFCFSTSKASMNVSACSPAVIARNPVYFTCWPTERSTEHTRGIRHREEDHGKVRKARSSAVRRMLQHLCGDALNGPIRGLP
jgi:hypothetical protein